MINTLVKILGNSKKTIYRWKEEKRPIIALLEKYFTEKDLEEFITNGKINRLEPNNNVIANNDLIYDILIDNAKYTVKEKLYEVFESSMLEKIYTYIAKNILIRVLEKLALNGKEYPINLSKEYLLSEIKNVDIKFYETYKLNVLINIIEENLSNIECFVLINYYEELFINKIK
ncbi:hypothetical protein D3M61_04805 [Aliarcobacter butzleri]|uniref:hypothetical protein n=1 Tax=Aliarcobacter butzleri TaxID=28197 RepID=UPI00102DF996|nr:hypothetical protein [Aliarcobacter butzleri]RZV14562.1 hypothetical protein D3M61_04805 [Aliarcobacter butzleri]